MLNAVMLMRTGLIWVTFVSVSAFGHPGRTNGIGCHKDNKNSSSHCHPKTESTSGAEFPQVIESAAAEPPALLFPNAQEIGTSDSSSTLTVTTWNVKHMGRSGLEVATVAELVQNADIITFQEVNTAESGKQALQEIATKLNQILSEKICWALSERPTEGAEIYAYLWKDKKIAYVKVDHTILETCPSTALTIRLGVKNASQIKREPAFGTFYDRSSKTKFVLASIHLVPADKKPQLEVPHLFDTFRDVTQPTIIAGDFNLDSSHSSFQSARELGFEPAFVRVKTTLKKKKRELSKPYDNFWFKGVSIRTYKVINLFDAFPKMSAKDIYRNLSDHNPVEATFEFGNLRQDQKTQ